MVYEGKTGCHDMLRHRSQPEINVIAVLCSTVQYSTVQYSTVQYSTVQFSTVQYSAVQYITSHYVYEYSISKNTHLDEMLFLLLIAAKHRASSSSTWSAEYTLFPSASTRSGTRITASVSDASTCKTISSPSSPISTSICSSTSLLFWM